MKYYGICPASCGEFVQGVMDRAEYLCSYAVDLYSTAEVEEKLNNINLGPLKSRKAIEAVFKKFNIPVEESKNISLKIRSKIPVGKGMASAPGIAAKLFNALYKEDINIKMIDQGSSEMNILVGIDTDDFEKAVNLIYNAFNN